MARAAVALLHILVAVGSGVPAGTNARVVRRLRRRRVKIHTDARIHTGTSTAVVSVYLAVMTRVASVRAVARVGAKGHAVGDGVGADSAIAAGRGGALIDVAFALIAFPSGRAVASVHSAADPAVTAGLRALSAILARLRRALIHVGLALIAGVPFWTRADIGVHTVCAIAPTLARV